MHLGGKAVGGYSLDEAVPPDRKHPPLNQTDRSPIQSSAAEQVMPLCADGGTPTHGDSDSPYRHQTLPFPPWPPL